MKLLIHPTLSIDAVKSERPGTCLPWQLLAFSMPELPSVVNSLAHKNLVQFTRRLLRLNCSRDLLTISIQPCSQIGLPQDL